jgi:hypothetical protein
MLEGNKISTKGKRYYWSHREELLAKKKNDPRNYLWGRTRDQKYKRIVMGHYSKGTPICARCGITDLDVLTIDHINNNGATDRKVKGKDFYRILINEKLPEGYQVLCFNCNFKKRIEISLEKHGVKIE